MSRIGKHIIWFDTETTGLESSVDQIIQAGFVVDDASGNEVERVEFLVKLKDGVIPSPVALTKNKLNPFSKKWKKQAITENQLAEKFAQLAEKYNTTLINAKKSGKPIPEVGSPEYNRGKPIVAAYNAPFDKGFTAITMARAGRKLSDYVSKSWINPMMTAKKLITAGKLTTKLNDYDRQSAALGAVAEAYGIKFEGDGAHTAVSDATVMKKAHKIMFKEATGYEMHEVFTDPSDFKEGEVYHLITDSASSGVKTRHVHVLKNDPEKGQIIALDEDDIRKNGELKDSAIRTFNYDTIVGEKNVDDQSAISLNAYVKTRSEEIGTWFKAALTKAKKSSASDEVFDEDTRNFDLIEGIAERMVKATDKRSEFSNCYADLMAKFNNDHINAKTVLTKAERLAQAKGHKGWSREINPEKTVPVLLHDDGKNFLKVALHPSGEFKVGLDYEKNGEVYNLSQPCKDAKAIKKLLEDKDIDLENFKDFLADLPTKSEFKDPKHPLAMEEELKKALAYLKINKDETEVQNAVGGVLKLLKEASPTLYAKYKDLPMTEFEENYWADENSNLNSERSPMTAEEARLEYGAVHSDHLKPGDKASKVPCALCGRALSAEISKSFSMGPTCRAKAEAVDQSQEPVESFVEEMVSYHELKKPLRHGEVAALKYTQEDGRTQTIFGETQEVHEDYIRVINRRGLRQSLESGYNPAMCVVINTIKIPTEKVTGVGRIDPEKIANINKGVA